MRVADVMTSSVVTVEKWTSLKDAARIMLANGVSGLPVVDDSGDLVGIITEADFVARQVAHIEGRRRLLDVMMRRSEPTPDTATVEEAMTKAPITIDPDATVNEAARRMVAAGVKRLPVIDLTGRLVGIVSRGDIMSAFARSDEAIENEVREGILTRLLFHPADAVGVTVKDGVVTLRGELPNRSDVRLLVALADRLDGIVKVEDHLTWRYDDQPSGPP